MPGLRDAPSASDWKILRSFSIRSSCLGRGWFGDFETIATHKMTHTARKYISCICPKHQRSCPGSTVVPSSRANRPVQPRAYAFVTNEQQQARSHTHLRAPGPRPTRMRTRHGSDLRPLQVWATSSKHPRSPETAHSSKQRAARDGTPPHTMHSMRTLAAATACLGTTIDRRASHRRTAPCRHNLRAAHRHAAPSGPSVLPCGAVDRWAERDAEELVHTWSPRMFQSHAITSAIMSAWTSPGTLPLEDLLTSRSNGSTSVRTQQQK